MQYIGGSALGLYMPQQLYKITNNLVQTVYVIQTNTHRIHAEREHRENKNIKNILKFIFIQFRLTPAGFLR